MFFRIFYLFERETTSRERAEAEEQAYFPLSGEPNIGLYPKTLGSGPHPVAPLQEFRDYLSGFDQGSDISLKVQWSHSGHLN